MELIIGSMVKEGLSISACKKVLDHFTQYGCRFYKQYVDAGFPSGDYIAKDCHRDH